MSRPKQRKGGRVTPKGTGARSPSPVGGPLASTPYGTYNDAPLSDSWNDERDDGELAEGLPGVIALAGDAIASGHPAELLVLTSSVAEAIEGGSAPDDGPGADDDLTWASVVDELAGAVRPETTALLYALRPLAPEEWSSRIATELAGRSTPGLPAWISAIGDVEVTGVWVRRDEMDDDPAADDDVFVVARWSTGQEMTFIVNVGHHPDPVVQDALLAPMDVAALSASVAIDDGPMELVALEPSDARASLQAAIARWDESSPDDETDEWPSTRPLLEWLLSTLPEGGEERWPGAAA